MEDARWMRPLFLHFGCSGVSGRRRPATLALAVAGYRQDRLGQQVRARLRGLAVLREGSGEAPSPAWGLDRRIRCPSLPVRPRAGTTGPRLN